MICSIIIQSRSSVRPRVIINGHHFTEVLAIPYYPNRRSSYSSYYWGVCAVDLHIDILSHGQLRFEKYDIHFNKNLSELAPFYRK